jgi:hypothetical protein
MNSLAVLATHAAAATRYLVGDVVGGVPSGRVRETEFRTVGVDGEQLRARLGEAARFAEGVAAKLTAEELGQERFSPQHNRNFTVAWSLFRALDHLAEHVGHAQLTRLLWQQQKSPV